MSYLVIFISNFMVFRIAGLTFFTTCWINMSMFSTLGILFPMLFTFWIILSKFITFWIMFIIFWIMFIAHWTMYSFFWIRLSMFSAYWTKRIWTESWIRVFVLFIFYIFCHWIFSSCISSLMDLIFLFFIVLRMAYLNIRSSISRLVAYHSWASSILFLAMNTDFITMLLSLNVDDLIVFTLLFAMDVFDSVFFILLLTLDVNELSLIVESFFIGLVMLLPIRLIHWLIERVIFRSFAAASFSSESSLLCLTIGEFIFSRSSCILNSFSLRIKLSLLLKWLPYVFALLFVSILASIFASISGCIPTSVLDLALDSAVLDSFFVTVFVHIFPSFLAQVFALLRTKFLLLGLMVCWNLKFMFPIISGILCVITKFVFVFFNDGLSFT